MDKQNQLYLGPEYVTLEGQFFKHPGNIRSFASPRPKKTRSKPRSFIGMDLETNHLTGRLNLMGFWDRDEKEYNPFRTNFLSALFTYVRESYFNKKSIVWWSKLDPFVVYKQFLSMMKYAGGMASLARWGKISGKYDRKRGEWDERPVASVKVGVHEFGIIQAIKGSVQFYFINENTPEHIAKTWAYDISSIYKRNLAEEGARFDYYSKGAKELHLVDWPRFDHDKDYRLRVLTSNMYDARVVADLADLLQRNFEKNAPGHYPKSLISTGSIARALITVACKGNKDDLTSIGIARHLDDIAKQLGEKHMKDFLSLLNESYSGGDIETFAYGHADSALYSDIASAYPAEGVNLLDLRGAEYETGEGPPPDVKDAYCFIRGDVTVPAPVYHHPITVKHPTIKDMNIRPNGSFRGSYTLEERKYNQSLGCVFENERWYLIRTKGELSPLALATRTAVEDRARLLKAKDSAEYIAKIMANAVYGLTYEATPEHEIINGGITRVGYRAGEFYNPVYATVMTSRTRIKIAKLVNRIKKMGGQPILAMTDSVMWTGTKDMMPPELVREQKTLGFYEGIETVTDVYCLGAGRYSYKKGKKYHAKTRGFRIQDLVSDKGVMLGFDWMKAIDHANTVGEMKVDVNVLVSVGLAFNQGKYGLRDAYDIRTRRKKMVCDLGLVTKERRKVDLLVGRSKRELPDIRPRELKERLFNTGPLMIPYFDLTHHAMREKTMRKRWLTDAQRKRKTSKRTSRTYHRKNKRAINRHRRSQYQKAIESGLTREDARRLSQRSPKNFEKGLRECLNKID